MYVFVCVPWKSKDLNCIAYLNLSKVNKADFFSQVERTWGRRKKNSIWDINGVGRFNCCHF